MPRASISTAFLGSSGGPVTHETSQSHLLHSTQQADAAQRLNSIKARNTSQAAVVAAVTWGSP